MTLTSDVNFPVMEDRAAIQIALSKVFEALLCSRIDSHMAGRLLYGLQIASQNLSRNRGRIPLSVETLAQSSTGEELAPELRICNRHDDCTACQHKDTCPNYNPDPDTHHAPSAENTDEVDDE